MDIEWEQRVRSAAFEFVRGLQQQHPDLLPASVLRHGFELDGQRIGVMSYASGIWKPRHLDAALSVMTTPPKSDEPPPYIDEWMDEARVSYAYRGDDPELHDNRAMRLAWEHHLPVIYLHGVAKGLYIAEFPVYVSRDRPSDLRVDLVIGTTPDDPAGINVEIDDRQYRVRPTRTRLHQHSFRMRVLRAYGERCAMCSLGHATLLDGAHIVPDGEPTGLPVVPNGLALARSIMRPTTSTLSVCDQTSGLRSMRNSWMSGMGRCSVMACRTCMACPSVSSPDAGPTGQTLAAWSGAIPSFVVRRSVDG